MKQTCTFFWFEQTWTCSRVDGTEDDFFGGECIPSEKEIKINSKYDDETFLDYLHHELLEGATFLIGCSYTKVYPDRHELFIMDHSQMDVVSGAVRGAYAEIQRKMDVKDISEVQSKRKVRNTKAPAKKARTKKKQ